VGRNHEQVADRVGMAGMTEQPIGCDPLRPEKGYSFWLAPPLKAQLRNGFATERYDATLADTARRRSEPPESLSCFLSAKYGFGPAWRPTAELQRRYDEGIKRRR